MNTYAPALPKQVRLTPYKNLSTLTHQHKAILGAHGYKLHENYDPRWRNIVVPEAFLKLVCPEAEERVKLVEGNNISSQRKVFSWLTGGWI